jgi:hypothetical protein
MNQFAFKVCRGCLAAECISSLTSLSDPGLILHEKLKFVTGVDVSFVVLLIFPSLSNFLLYTGDSRLHSKRRHDVPAMHR